MELVTKTKTVEYKVWQASDGTEFEKKEDCREYEEKLDADSAFFGLAEDLTLDDYYAVDALLDGGTGAADYFLVVPRTDEDVTVLKKWLSVHGAYPLSGKACDMWIGDESEIMAGGKYIAGSFDNGFNVLLFSEERIRQKMNRLLSLFEGGEENA